MSRVCLQPYRLEMKKVITEYSSNKSWWLLPLDKKDWENLENAWWVVKPADTEFICKDWDFVRDGRWVPTRAKTSQNTSTVPIYAWYLWNEKEAINSFEQVTWQDTGCEWCPFDRPPHRFEQSIL